MKAHTILELVSFLGLAIAITLWITDDNTTHATFLGLLISTVWIIVGPHIDRLH